MKSKHSEVDQRFLVLFKIDATNLFNRITVRATDYIEAFSLKRNRGVFKEVFENRYSYASINDLSHCPVEVIEVLSGFYTEVDNLYWYLKITQDMPNTIEDEVTRRLSKIERNYEQVLLFIDAELSGLDIDINEVIEPDNLHDLELKLDGEKRVENVENEFIKDETYPSILDDE